MPLPDYSDFVVFADESGDIQLDTIDPQFPMFALALCVIETTAYVEQLVPAVQNLKFKYWGHDNVVLHEHEIRKPTGDFAWLRADKEIRESFMEDLASIIREAPISVIGSIIDKKALVERYDNPFDPYDLALEFCLERLLSFLRSRDQLQKQTHVVFECRGAAEDAQLELTFRRIVSNSSAWGYRQLDFQCMDFQPRFAHKRTNSTGLQVADLIARPMALSVLRPGQPNRSWEIIEQHVRYKKVFP